MRKKNITQKQRQKQTVKQIVNVKISHPIRKTSKKSQVREKIVVPQIVPQMNTPIYIHPPAHNIGGMTDIMAPISSSLEKLINKINTSQYVKQQEEPKHTNVINNYFKDNVKESDPNETFTNQLSNERFYNLDNIATPREPSSRIDSDENEEKTYLFKEPPIQGKEKQTGEPMTQEQKEKARNPWLQKQEEMDQQAYIKKQEEEERKDLEKNYRENILEAEKFDNIARTLLLKYGDRQGKATKDELNDLKQLRMGLGSTKDWDLIRKRINKNIDINNDIMNENKKKLHLIQPKKGTIKGSKKLSGKAQHDTRVEKQPVEIYV